MVTSKFFRTNHQVTNKLNTNPVDLHTSHPQTSTPQDNRLSELEEHLAHLSQQKDLHTLALKEMYQFLCKMDATFRVENQKLHDMIRAEQQRSAQLIEVTKGLWDIIEMMDDAQEESSRLIDLTQEVEELAQFEVEITDESHRDLPDRSEIDKLMPIVEAS